jgi:hypothetical protein
MRVAFHAGTEQAIHATAININGITAKVRGSLEETP